MRLTKMAPFISLTVQVHLNYDKSKRNAKAIASFWSLILKLDKVAYCKINMGTSVLFYIWTDGHFFYVTWPLRTWIITAFHDFLSFVDLTKVCIFTNLLKPWSVNKLGRLSNVTCCFSCIPYVLGVANILCNLCILETPAVTFLF